MEYTYKGVTYSSVKKLVEGSGTKNSLGLVSTRLSSGWPIDEALEKPKVNKKANTARIFNCRSQKNG